MLTCPMLILTLYCNLGITRFGKENKKGTENPVSNINYYNISALEQYRNIMTILTANPDKFMINSWKLKKEQAHLAEVS